MVLFKHFCFTWNVFMFSCRLMMRHQLLVWSMFWRQPAVDCVLLTQSIILNHLSSLCCIHLIATLQALRLVASPWKWWTTLLALLLYVTANQMLSPHLSVIINFKWYYLYKPSCEWRSKVALTYGVDRYTLCLKSINQILPQNLAHIFLLIWRLFWVRKMFQNGHFFLKTPSSSF